MMNMRQKAIKLEIVSQPTQGCQVERSWSDLPLDLTTNILHRVGAVDIFQSVPKVCTTWRNICKDPAMWRVLYMDASSPENAGLPIYTMCRHAVDRSQGQLVDITIVEFGRDWLFKYIANRCSQLKHLTIANGDENMYSITWVESLMKLPLLEELSLYNTDLSVLGIEAVGRYCPMLKTFKLNGNDLRLWKIGEFTNDKQPFVYDESAIAIGNTYMS